MKKHASETHKRRVGSNKGRGETAEEKRSDAVQAASKQRRLIQVQLNVSSVDGKPPKDAGGNVVGSDAGGSKFLVVVKHKSQKSAREGMWLNCAEKGGFLRKFNLL